MAGKDTDHLDADNEGPQVDEEMVQNRNLLAVIQIESHMDRSQEEAITVNVDGS